MDITRDTPSDKSFDTIINLLGAYNLDDSSAEYVFGGSILQASGATIFDGVQIVANSGCHTEIVQNGAIIANDFWNNNHAATGIKGINPDSANGIAARFMVKVRTGGSDIDGRKLLFQTREWGKTYSEFKVNGTGRGINVVPLTYADDLNNTTLIATIAAIGDISNTEGYRSIDVNNDSTPENYYSEWDRGANSINTFYERMKWLSRRGSASTLYGLNGELFRGITHEVSVTTPRSGTVSEGASATWSGGTGQVLARDSGATATKLWIQLLTGVAPTAGQTITVGAASVTASGGTPSSDRTLSFPFCGVSTGSAIIGAYGFGLQALDLSSSDKVFDLTNTQRQAPNYQSFTVGGIIHNEDYVIVAPNDGGSIDLNFFTLNGALSGATVTSVVVNEAIPTWLPSSGSIRILRANGVYSRHPYSAYNTGSKTFTITSHDFSGNNAANGANCYPTPVDGLAVGTTITAGNFVTGTQYVIKTAGTTNFTLIGAANSSPGTIFTATGPGTGTGDAYTYSASLSFTGIYTSDVSLYVRVRDGGATPIKTFATTATFSSGGGGATAVRTSDA